MTARLIELLTPQSLILISNFIPESLAINELRRIPAKLYSFAPLVTHICENRLIDFHLLGLTRAALAKVGVQASKQGDDLRVKGLVFEARTNVKLAPSVSAIDMIHGVRFDTRL